ncbi:MAG: helix-turn-helix domain-containing protein [Lawsonibacter sp.]
MDNIRTGALIRRLRRELGLTQLQLAGRLGVSDKAVSKWERGLGSPEVSTLPRLSQVLGVDLARMLQGI